MTDADERQLVEAAQRDPARFAALYERHFDRIYAYVVLRVRDRDAAEDVTSDIFNGRSPRSRSTSRAARRSAHG